jgi:hypothetical protein
MIALNQNELYLWIKKYDEDQNESSKTVEEELRAKFVSNPVMTKTNLQKIIDWKYQDLPGRKNRMRKLTNEYEDRFIQDLSKLAFKQKKDELKLRIFSVIKGVGPATCSVILSFYNPWKYGILDIHVWRELFGEKEPKTLFSNNNHAIKFFDKLRKISKQTGLSCRDIEKAYFKKNYDEARSIE